MWMKIFVFNFLWYCCCFVVCIFFSLFSFLFCDGYNSVWAEMVFYVCVVIFFIHCIVAYVLIAVCSVLRNVYLNAVMCIRYVRLFFILHCTTCVNDVCICSCTNVCRCGVCSCVDISLFTLQPSVNLNASHCHFVRSSVSILYTSHMCVPSENTKYENVHRCSYAIHMQTWFLTF